MTNEQGFLSKVLIIFGFTLTIFLIIISLYDLFRMKNRINELLEEKIMIVELYQLKQGKNINDKEENDKILLTEIKVGQPMVLYNDIYITRKIVNDGKRVVAFIEKVPSQKKKGN